MLTCICYLCYCTTLPLQTKLRKTKMMLRKIHRQSAQQEAYVFTMECSSKEVFCFLQKKPFSSRKKPPIWGIAVLQILIRKKRLESRHHLSRCVTCSPCRNEILFCLSQKWVNSSSKDLGASPSWWASVSGICC